MAKPEKEAKVAELSDKLRSAQSMILADYQGLDVAAITELRRKMRAAGIDYQVVKNTLALRAARAAGLDVLEKLLSGPTAIAFGRSELSVPAKLITDFAKENQFPKIKGGVWEGQLLGGEEVAAIASLPGKDILRGQLLSALLRPLTNLCSLLLTPPKEFVGTLTAWSEKSKPEKP